MKFTTKLILFWASVFLIFLLGIVFVLTVIWDFNFTFWQIAVAFLINGIIPPAIITSFFRKRLNYMESETIDPPNFRGMKMEEISFVARTKAPFDELMQKVDRQYIISFSDRKNKVLKFRTDCRMLSWGIGGYVKMISPNKVQVVAYPITENSKRDNLAAYQVIRILKSIFNPHE